MSEPLLTTLDSIRRRSGTPAPGPIIREISPDGSQVRIVYSACSDTALPAIIRREVSRAFDMGADFEWKLYGHDRPPRLHTALLQAGLIAEDRETVLALDLRQLPETVESAMKVTSPAVRASVAQLADYAQISLQSGRSGVDAERSRLATTMTDDPDSLQVHIVYVDGSPVSAGRLLLDRPSAAAELAGGPHRPGASTAWTLHHDGAQPHSGCHRGGGRDPLGGRAADLGTGSDQTGFHPSDVDAIICGRQRHRVGVIQHVLPPAH